MAQMNSIIVISTNENSLKEGEGGGGSDRGMGGLRDIEAQI